MPGIEIHTLNQVDTELPEALLARAIRTAEGIGYDAHEKAPEQPGAFSLGATAAAGSISLSPALTVVGEYLPSLESQQDNLAAMQESELLGGLMKDARLSKLTGCIMRTSVSRDHKGYSKTAIKAVRELGLGSSSRGAHRVVYFARRYELTGQLPTDDELSMEIDHICRNPACMNCAHTRAMTGKDNNLLRYDANLLEPVITQGRQLFIGDMIDRYPWLTHAMAFEDDMPRLTISTRLGPFILRIANKKQPVVYGERLDGDIFDELKPFSKKPIRRKSRAKPRIYVPIPGSVDIFEEFRNLGLDEFGDPAE